MPGDFRWCCGRGVLRTAGYIQGNSKRHTAVLLGVTEPFQAAPFLLQALDIVLRVPYSYIKAEERPIPPHTHDGIRTHDDVGFMFGV